MENFAYYTPTKVVFGKGAEKQAGELVKEQGCTLVMVTHDPQLASWADRIIKVIDGKIVSIEVKKKESTEDEEMV